MPASVASGTSSFLADRRRWPSRLGSRGRRRLCVVLLGLVLFRGRRSLIPAFLRSGRLGLLGDDALFALGDLAGRTNERTNPRGLALEIGNERVVDLAVAGRLAARRLIVLGSGLGCIVQIAVDGAGEAAKPGQLLLRSAHLVGCIDIGRTCFVEGRGHQRAEPLAGETLRELLQVVLCLWARGLQGVETILFILAGGLLLACRVGQRRLTSLLIALLGGVALGLLPRLLGGLGCHLGLGQGRGVGKLLLPIFFRALECRFALGLLPRLLGCLGFCLGL